MGNRKRLLTGSEQTGKQKLESGSGGNRNLKIGGNPGTGRIWIDRPRTTRPVQEGTFSRG